VDVPCTARLPLVTILAIGNTVEGLSNDVEEALKAKIKLGRNNVRVVLNVIRYDILTLLISTSLLLTIARKITIKIVPLIISVAPRTKECSSSTKTPNLRH
jgi:hypothetical protein